MEQRSNSLSIPGAIVIAAAIIAVAIIYIKKPAYVPVQQTTEEKPRAEISLNPITAADHILGNPNAPIRIVEFSDPSCPFCKIFHPTMKSIIDTYGPSGNVAWVYRAFPLDKPDLQGRVLHPNAGHESQSMECAAALGGNNAFWKFTNRLYEITPSDQGKPLDQTQLPAIATSAGLDAVTFNECLSSGRFKDKVEKQYLDGINAGVSGTPTSIFVLSKPAPTSLDIITADLALRLGVPIIISSDRSRISVSGAVPKEALQSIIDPLISTFR